MSGLVLFLAVYVRALIRALRGRSMLAALLAGFFTNLVVAHTFAGLFLAFLVWGVLVSILLQLRAASPSRPAGFRAQSG